MFCNGAFSTSANGMGSSDCRFSDCLTPSRMEPDAAHGLRRGAADGWTKRALHTLPQLRPPVVEVEPPNDEHAGHHHGHARRAVGDGRQADVRVRPHPRSTLAPDEQSDPRSRSVPAA